MSKITIRPATTHDARWLLKLYQQTIRTVNRKDYNKIQVNCWAPLDMEIEVFERYIDLKQPFVATDGERIVGYSDVQPDGLIDHFYCHHKSQGQGVGRALMNVIHEKANEMALPKLYSFVSITAKPFYLHFGFDIVRENEANVRGVGLKNLLMEKEIG
ncbi:GNAT family N-acetyltransferase [Vibrio sp. CB1-14]|uniref:N-acetyltransferase family protein n=1 Tax=Vibrio chaetopteri TaxID=3016528 RepID=A0AAU8BFR7_9VIBR